MLKKVYIHATGNLPAYVQFSSTWQENVYVAMVEPEIEKKLREDVNVYVIIAQPIRLR